MANQKSKLIYAQLKNGYMRMALEDILIPNIEDIKITSVVATDNFGNTYESSAYFVYYA